MKMFSPVKPKTKSRAKSLEHQVSKALNGQNETVRIRKINNGWIIATSTMKNGAFLEREEFSAEKPEIVAGKPRVVRGYATHKAAKPNQPYEKRKP